MRLPRVRFTVRRMMIAVAVVALAIWGQRLAERSAYCRAQATYCRLRQQGHTAIASRYEWLAQNPHGYRIGPDSVRRSSLERRGHYLGLAARFGALADRFERAIWTPWRLPPADPHHPDVDPDADRRPALVPPTAVRATFGRGTALAFKTDHQGERIWTGAMRRDPDTAQTERVWTEEPTPIRWVVITGILDHQAVCRNYERALRGDAPSAYRLQPAYHPVSVEQQMLRPDGRWSSWEAARTGPDTTGYDLAYNYKQETMPEGVRIGSYFVDHLPFLVEGQWREINPAGLVPRRDPSLRAVPNYPELMIRKVQFDVVPGQSYRYRMRMRARGWASDYYNDHSSDPGDFSGPWSETSNVVSIPPEP